MLDINRESSKEVIGWLNKTKSNLRLEIIEGKVVDYGFIEIDKDLNHYSVLTLHRPHLGGFDEIRKTQPNVIMTVLNEIYEGVKSEIREGDYSTYVDVYTRGTSLLVKVVQNRVHNEFVLKPYDFDPKAGINSEPYPESLKSIVNDEFRRVFWLYESDINRIFEWEISFMLKRIRNQGYKYYEYSDLYAESLRKRQSTSNWEVFDKQRNISLVISDESKENIISKIIYHLNNHENWREEVVDYDLYHLRLSNDHTKYQVLGEFQFWNYV